MCQSSAAADKNSPAVSLMTAICPPSSSSDQHPLADGHPPTWADAWGQDRYSPWAGFSIKAVQQRLRWIAPGRFMMGSPGHETGRLDNEGPQHEVIISRGYWLFETPCT
ncbi:MAG: hypothetical protein R2750_14610, partial [Bacteroidales bacterium]